MLLYRHTTTQAGNQHQIVCPCDTTTPFPKIRHGILDDCNFGWKIDQSFLKNNPCVLADTIVTIQNTHRMIVEQGCPPPFTGFQLLWLWVGLPLGSPNAAKLQKKPESFMNYKIYEYNNIIIYLEQLTSFDGCYSPSNFKLTDQLTLRRSKPV